ncbi:MAG: hypothetical protein M3016_01410, partial [Actinomycetota bacterium]|nr:hypothetical protein [Actinomycetota bacterium]
MPERRSGRRVGATTVGLMVASLYFAPVATSHDDSHVQDSNQPVISSKRDAGQGGNPQVTPPGLAKKQGDSGSYSGSGGGSGQAASGPAKKQPPGIGSQ